MFLINEVSSKKIGETIFETKVSKRKALCKYYVTDSEGEYTFAQELEKDDDVLMYSKLKKGSIVIENPIENYSPDWVVVCKGKEEKRRKYLIIETKWDKKWEDLSEKEQTKIICAKKHFEAINNDIEYSVINSIDGENLQNDEYMNNWKMFKEKMIKEL